MSVPLNVGSLISEVYNMCKEYDMKASRIKWLEPIMKMNDTAIRWNVSSARYEPIKYSQIQHENGCKMKIWFSEWPSILYSFKL